MNSSKILQQSDLMKNLNLDNLPPEKQEELMQNMTDIVLDRVLIRVFKSFNSKDVECFNEFLDEDKSEEAIVFLKEKAPNFNNILDEEIIRFEKEIVQVLA